jgi:membrane-bound ClpP family serine protease
MIGLEGRVIKTLTPIGTVIVGGEYWRAKSVNGNIGVDESVEIVGVDRLTLKVKRKHQ